MLKRYIYTVVFLLLVSCYNHFHQSPASVKKQKTIIRNYINAEDTRDSVVLEDLLADTLTTYWKIENPQLAQVFPLHWRKCSFPK
jgi:hypothetical protein